LELADRKGAVIRVAEVTAVVGLMFTNIKSQMLGVPSRVSRQLVGETDFNVIYRTIDEAVRRGLTDLSKDKYDEGMAAERRERIKETHGALARAVRTPDPPPLMRSMTNGASPGICATKTGRSAGVEPLLLKPPVGKREKVRSVFDLNRYARARGHYPSTGKSSLTISARLTGVWAG